jgi:hypothetical protein
MGDIMIQMLKYFFCVSLLINGSVVFASSNSVEKKLTGEDVLPNLAATCSNAHWVSLLKWNRFDQLRSLSVTTEIPNVQNETVNYEKANVVFSTTDAGIELKSGSKIIKGSDFCELLINTDGNAFKKSVWQVFGLINQAWAESQKPEELKKYILGAALTGKFDCIGKAIVDAAACGVISAAGAKVGDSFYSSIKLNSCSADQVILEYTGSRMIATKSNHNWILKIVDLANEDRNTVPRSEDDLRYVREHIYRVSTLCHNQADVDKINKAIKEHQAETKARIATISSESKSVVNSAKPSAAHQ